MHLKYRSPNLSNPVVALNANPSPNAKSGSPRTSPAATEAFQDSKNSFIREGRMTTSPNFSYGATAQVAHSDTNGAYSFALNGPTKEANSSRDATRGEEHSPVRASTHRPTSTADPEAGSTAEQAANPTTMVTRIRPRRTSLR